MDAGCPQLSKFGWGVGVPNLAVLNLVDVADIFNFFLLGEGEGSLRRRGGDRFFIEHSRREGGEAGRDREGVCGELGNFRGRGLNFFCWGQKVWRKSTLVKFKEA